MTVITARVGSAITVLNGIALGKGSAMGTTPNQEISLEPADGLQFDTLGVAGSELLRTCIEEFAEITDTSVDNIKITTHMKLPPSKGLKTSSAVACGTLDVMNQYFGTSLSSIEIIELSAKASISAGVSITGAIDDAYASYKGGFVVTDNSSNELLGSHQLQLNKDVLFLIPDKSNPKSDIQTEFDLLDKYILEKAFKEALHGDWKHAIERNSRVYGQYYLEDWDIINSIEDRIEGTVGLNGAGPALFVISDPSMTTYNIEQLENHFTEYELTRTELR